MESGRPETARQLRLNIDLPKSFFDILGPGQARVEIEGLKREISATTNNRIHDAINRKIASNSDLKKENESLKTVIGNLQHIIVNNNKQAEFMRLENNHLKMLIEDNFPQGHSLNSFANADI